MPRRPVLTLVPFAIAGSLLLLGACGGGGDSEDRLDAAADQLTELEDAVDDLARQLVTTSSTVPPPATLATAPPTTRDPSSRPTTTTIATAIAADLDEATAEAILALVGASSWDPELPIPTVCVANGTFTPTGENGINGGRIDCSVPALGAQVEEYYRLALARLGFPFQASSNEDGFSISIGGSAASIVGTATGDTTDLTIEQRFP